MKFASSVAIACACAAVGGCFSVESTKLAGDSEARQVFVRNYGKYLFDCVPIWCGNVNENPKFDFVMFRDDVTMDKMQHRFLAECSRLGTDVTDVACHTDNNIFIQLPIWSFSIPIPYIWTHHEIQISGVVR